MQKNFHDHLLSKGDNGLINDVEIVFTNKTDPSQPTRREEFWRNKLKTLAPYGLNVWKLFLQVCIVSGSSSLIHFNKTAIYSVSKCQFFKVVFCSVIEGLTSFM